MPALATAVRKPLGRARRAGFRAFERALNVDTGGEVELEDLNVDAPEREGYEGSGWIDLRRMLRRGEVSPQDVFVDLGAGKGKIVMLAARYQFARVTGVEISEDLNVICRRNLAQGRYKQRAKQVELVTADIAEYEIPDDVTVAYIYNTVRGETFDRVIANLVASVDRRPRSMRVIYLNAQGARPPDGHGPLQAPTHRGPPAPAPRRGRAFVHPHVRARAGQHLNAQLR